MRGDEAARVEVEAPDQTPPLRDALQRSGVPVFEADVRFAMRYLIDRGIRGALEIETAGPRRKDDAAERRGSRSGADHGPYPVDVVFDDPGLRPAEFRPGPDLLRVVSIDLETDPRGEEIYSAALAGTGLDEVLLALPQETVSRALKGETLPGRVIACGDEKSLLRALFARMTELDFDVLTGWNVIDFDLDVLVARARALGVAFEVGRAPGGTRVIRERAFWGRSRADMTGRVVLDGIDLLRSSFVRLDDYRLDTAARAILGEGKVALGSGEAPVASHERAEAITRIYHDDLPRFVRYNLADARLALAILDKAQLLALAVRRSLLTGMPLDRVGASAWPQPTIQQAALDRS